MVEVFVLTYYSKYWPFNSKVEGVFLREKKAKQVVLGTVEWEKIEDKVQITNKGVKPYYSITKCLID